MSGETLEFRIVANTAGAVRNLAKFDSQLAQTGGMSIRHAAAVRQSLQSINNVKLRNTFLRALEKQVNQTANATERAANRVQSSYRKFNRGGSLSSGIFAGVVGGTIVAGFDAITSAMSRAATEGMRLSDTASSIEAKLRLATAKQGSYAKANADVEKISRKTRNGISETADLYSTMARNSDRLGLSQKQVAAATQTVGMALKIGGQGAQQNAAAILQLSQAMSAGTLAGDEYRSINENAPRLMDLFAESLGVAKDELKKMSKEGKITGQVIAKALTDPKLAAKIEAEFAKIPVTFADIGTAAENSAVTFAGAFSKGFGLGNSLAQVLMNLQTYAVNNKDAFEAFGKSTYEVFQQISLTVKSVYGVITTVFGAIRTHFDTIRAVAIGAATGFVFYRTATLVAAAATTAFGQAILFNSSVVLATARNVGIGAAAQVAFSAATAAATGGVRAFTAALMANPLGLIAVAISTVVTLMLALSDSTDEATRAAEAKAKADELVAETAKRRAEFELQLMDMTDAQKRATIAAANEAIRKAKADQIAAKQALERAKAELALARALGQKQIAQGMRSTAGAGGGIDRGMVAINADERRRAPIDARIKAEEERIKRNEATIKEQEGRIAAAEKSLAAVDTPRTPTAPKPDGKKKKKEGETDAEKAAKKYAEAVKDLNAELQDYNVTAEQKALLDAFENAGLARKVDLTGKQADEIRNLVGQISDAKKAKAVNEALDELDQAFRELTYSETQLAQVEARRRAGLSEDLSYHDALTDAVDARSAAYAKLAKAQKDAEEAKDIRAGLQDRDSDAEFDRQQIAAGDDPMGNVETKRQLAEIDRQSNAEKTRIMALEVVTLEQRQAGMTGILQAEKDALLAQNDRITAQEKANVLQERQAELASRLSDFMSSMWDDPMATMKKFFQDFMKRILEAILKSIILKQNLGGSGGGGIGGMIGNALLGAIGARASGGSVSKDMGYRINEKGQEVFFPGRAGEVLNARKTSSMMGGGNANITFGNTTINVASASPADRAALGQQLKDQERQQVAIIRRELKNAGIRV